MLNTLSGVSRLQHREGDLWRSLAVSLSGHTADSLERPKPLELAEQSTGEKRLHTYMCAHIYMHTHVHICIYIHVHVHIHTQLRDLKGAHLDSSSEK